MRRLWIIPLPLVLFCAVGAVADEAGQQVFNQAIERFERLQIMLREAAERGGIEEDAPLAKEMDALFQEMRTELGEALEARRGQIPLGLAAEIENRAKHLEAILEEIGAVRGAVEAPVLEELAARFHALMDPVGAALGVPRPPRQTPSPAHFDVTARIEFAIEGVGETMVVSLAAPHYLVQFEWNELLVEGAAAAKTEKETRGRFEAEGELHPVGERWFLICNGSVALVEQLGDQKHSEGEMEFNASALLVPGEALQLVGAGQHHLHVTLHLDE